MVVILAIDFDEFSSVDQALDKTPGEHLVLFAPDDIIRYSHIVEDMFSPVIERCKGPSGRESVAGDAMAMMENPS